MEVTGPEPIRMLPTGARPRIASPLQAKALLDAGTINQEEFAKLKAKALA